MDHRQEDRSLGCGGDRLGGMRCLGRSRGYFSRFDPPGVCRADSFDVPHRLGYVPRTSGRDFLSAGYSHRAGFADDGSRPPAAQALGGELALENSGWQNRSSQLSSAKLMSQKSPSQFEEQAAKAGVGFFTEFWVFLKENKKWWLLPILLAFLLMGALLLAGGTGAAPFIYTLF